MSAETYAGVNLREALLVNAIVLAEGGWKYFSQCIATFGMPFCPEAGIRLPRQRRARRKWVVTLLKGIALKYSLTSSDRGTYRSPLFRFGALDVVPHIAAPLQLLVDADASVFEVEVRFCETAELRDAQPVLKRGCRQNAS